jgi:hypothetical protein
MEVKQKQVSIFVDSNRRVSNIVVALSFPFAGVSPIYFKKNRQTALENGLEEASLAMALFDHIKEKLIGSPLEQNKTRVTSVEMAFIDGNFTIYWQTSPTGSSLRKTLSVVFKCLTPDKLFPKYTQNIRFFTGKPVNKDEFYYCVKKMASGIKDKIDVSVIGKINMTKEKLQDLLSGIVKNIPVYKSSSSGSAPEKRKPDNSESDKLTTIKTNPTIQTILYNYIKLYLHNVPIEFVNDKMVIDMPATNWETGKKKLNDKERITAYVQQKYGKLGNDLPINLAYLSTLIRSADAVGVSKIAKKKLTISEIVSSIQQLLK